MQQNLGRALSIVFLAQVREEIMHMDVAAFGAPSECHDAVSKGEEKRLRQARRHARAVSGVNRRQFRLALKGLKTRHASRLHEKLHAKHNPFWAMYS